MPVMPSSSEILPQARHHGLATKSQDFRQAGLRFPQTKDRCLCGRLLLAQLPQTRNTACIQSCVLEKEAHPEQSSRPTCEPHAPATRMDGPADLATRTDSLAQRAISVQNRAVTRAERPNVDFAQAFAHHFFVPDAWSREEVEAAVADYFDMLARELRGEPFNKAQHNRMLQRLLNNRSHGAIERKHQNISAILIELGYPYIDGYKPLGNYQELLRLVVEGHLSGAAGLNETVEALVEKLTEMKGQIGGIEAKVNQVKAAAQKWQQEGRDLAALQPIKTEIESAMSQGKFAEVNAALDRALKLLSGTDK